MVPVDPQFDPNQSIGLFEGQNLDLILRFDPKI